MPAQSQTLVPGPAEGVEKWNLKVAAKWIKDVAKASPNNVLDTFHSEEKGTERSISVGDAIDVIRGGMASNLVGPQPHNGSMSVTVTFQKKYKARTLKVVAAAKEGSPYVQLVSLQNVW